MPSPNSSRPTGFEDTDNIVRVHSLHDPSEYRADKRARSSTGVESGNVAYISSSSGDAHQQNHPNRAVQACLRCRKQKLRCLGGRPCVRCVKANKECNFGRTAPIPSADLNADESRKGEDNEDTEVVKNRLKHLESSVANLLAGLHNPGASDHSSTSAHQMDPTDTVPAPSFPPATEQWDYGILTSMSYTDDAVETLPQPLSTPADVFPSQGVRFGNSPEVNIISPNSYSSMSGPTFSAPVHQESRNLSRKGKGVGAEERLASATTDSFQPPFRALMYQPSVWENREASRRGSPIQSEGSVPRASRLSSVQEDPVHSGLIDLSTARTLFTFYVQHCHHFLPILDTTIKDPMDPIQRSPTLFSAILAIAGRFYCRHSTDTLRLDPQTPAALAEVAESLLAHTILRKQHSFADVQAILLLSAWGLQPGGKGPDAWVLTGHATRVARRLGVHRVVTQAVREFDTKGVRLTSANDEHGHVVRRQWRTWLALSSFDIFLSLGLGRPQCGHFESINDQAFLKNCLSGPLPLPGTSSSSSLYGDAYIAATAQLAQIGRSLFSWTEEQGSAMQPAGQSLPKMLSDLNQQLDEWSKLWIWSGSSYLLYLGPQVRIARLQADHLRLSINSMALRSTTDSIATEGNVTYLRKAVNSATSTIQAHSESSQTDLALSFATDYITITLAQAAVFLIRLTKASSIVQQIVSLDSSVVSHYLTMSIDLLELGDLSETRLSTYLARTIRGIAHAAGLHIRHESLMPTIAEKDHPGIQSEITNHTVMPAPASSMSDGQGFALDSFWGGQDEFDLSHFLGLSGGVTQDTDWLDLALRNADPSNLPESSTWDMAFEAE